MSGNFILKNSAKDPDSLDPQDFGFLDPDPDPRGKISNKNCKKTFLLLKPKSELLKKREIIKASSFLNGSSSFRIELREKIKQKFKIFFFFNSEMTWIRIHFF